MPLLLAGRWAEIVQFPDTQRFPDTLPLGLQPAERLPCNGTGHLWWTARCSGLYWPSLEHSCANINHQGSLRSRHMFANCPPSPLESEASKETTRQPSLSGEWRLHPKTVQLIGRRFGNAQVDLFASPNTSHCQMCFPPF